MSIPIDAAKKKLLKKLAKELGYKLEEAIFENIGDTVKEVRLSFIHARTTRITLDGLLRGKITIMLKIKKFSKTLLIRINQ